MTRARPLEATPAVPEAASENRKRGRPRASYSTRATAGETYETPDAGAGTRRGKQNQQLAFWAWHTLGHNWRPEWSWFWHAAPGAIDPPFERRHDLTRMAHSGAEAHGLNLPRARVGLLTELGRMGKADALAWATELAKLPLTANARRLEMALRHWRLGRETRSPVAVLAQEIARTVDRFRAQRDGVSLDDVEDALLDVLGQVRVARANEHAQAPPPPRVRVEAPSAPRIRVDGADELEELALVEQGGVLRVRAAEGAS